MSALGDIKLSKPVSLTKIAYTMGFIAAWTFPLFFIFGLRFDLWYLVLLFVPPFVLGHYASKPVFGGKNLFGFLKTTISYLQEPKGWADLKGVSKPDNEDFYVEQEIWISRRRETAKLGGNNG